MIDDWLLGYNIMFFYVDPYTFGDLYVFFCISSSKFQCAHVWPIPTWVAIRSVEIVDPLEIVLFPKFLVVVAFFEAALTLKA